MKEIIIKIVLAIALVIGFGAVCYKAGKSQQKTVYITQQAKANEKVIEKNDKMQEVADKEAKIQVVYKDRIVTKYQTITKEVIKYETTVAAYVDLDSEFVRLHNIAAAANDEIQITPTASGTDGSNEVVGVTTGEAIGVITRNYERYQQCQLKVAGWQRYYNDLQKTVSE